VNTNFLPFDNKKDNTKEILQEKNNDVNKANYHPNQYEK